MTLKFSNPSTLTSGVEALIVRLGVAETTAAKATTVKTEAQREEENIVVKAVGTSGLKGPGLSSLSVLPIAQSSFTSRMLSQLGSTALPEKDCYETKFGDIVKTQKASPKIAFRRSDKVHGFCKHTPERVAFQHPNASRGRDIVLLTHLIRGASGFNAKLLPTPVPRVRSPTRSGPPFLRYKIAHSRIRLVFELEGFLLGRRPGIVDDGGEGRKHKVC